MKKIIASAVGLALVGGVAVTTASAVESQFGGYWRTRAFLQDNFTQNAANDNNSSYNRTDTRTRLFYTAKFNDDFKFVNQFEFNTLYGDNNGGDIGSDGDTFVVKRSYADFTLGMVNTKLGIQGTVLNRGFAFDSDFTGAIVTADFGSWNLPVYYISGPQEDVNSGTTTLVEGDFIEFDEDGNEVFNTTQITTNKIFDEDLVGGDVHVLATTPSFMIGDAVKVTPTGIWATITEQDTDVYWVGADIDLKLDAVSAWGTFLYNGGEVDLGDGDSADISAWLVAGGAEVGVVHGQAFYATGDDNDADTDIDAFVSAPGQSYYWSEIMGFGIFDNTASQNSPGDQISNIAAFNLGVTLKPMDKLTLNLDAWYAMLDEDNAAGEDELGTEIDAVVSYELMENLNADLVFAYLIAGDATGEEDVMEGGVRLSLKF